jgi:hypothetical protein
MRAASASGMPEERKAMRFKSLATFTGVPSAAIAAHPQAARADQGRSPQQASLGIYRKIEMIAGMPLRGCIPNADTSGRRVQPRVFGREVSHWHAALSPFGSKFAKQVIDYYMLFGLRWLLSRQSNREPSPLPEIVLHFINGTILLRSEN